MPSAPTIRRATAQERSAVAATVAAAFATDPGWAFILGADYERVAPHFAGALFDKRVERGTVWVEHELAGVSMWDGPGADDATHAHEGAWERFRELAGEEVWARVEVYDEAVAAAAAPLAGEPFWYLGVLATHPSRRREGIATALLAPALADADRRGLACCLETSTAANRRFYEARGFTDATAVALPGGPATWWLRRGSGEAG